MIAAILASLGAAFLVAAIFLAAWSNAEMTKRPWRAPLGIALLSVGAGLFFLSLTLGAA